MSVSGPRMPRFFTSSGPPESYLVSRWIFLRLLAAIYLCAFVSLWLQVAGLIGSDGILPCARFFVLQDNGAGWSEYSRSPSLCWISTSDAFVQGLCAAGACLSGLVMLGIAPVLALMALWVLYLSLCVAGQDFMQFQWDSLLLETGFLAIFYAPWQLWERPSRQRRVPKISLWLLRWLLFRLMFESGMVKWMSGDPTWIHLKALHYHYETQPLPIWTSWYMFQLPGGFQSLSVVFTFCVELIVPFLIWGTRPYRYCACVGIISLQVLIEATGNYGFFNLLSMVLCVLLLDDRAFPSRLRNWLMGTREAEQPRRGWEWPGWVLAPVAVCLVVISSMPLLQMCALWNRWPAFLLRAYYIAQPFRSVNSYGLFAMMTTSRPEIIVEGSDDGEEWRAYEFRWKPGDVHRAPRWTGPHMPRLDWQMWFAALGSADENDWFKRFLRRLLEGSPLVLQLMDRNPFPERPPRWIRATLYDYHFTHWHEGTDRLAWWKRTTLRPYFPASSLRKSDGAAIDLEDEP